MSKRERAIRSARRPKLIKFDIDDYTFEIEASAEREEERYRLGKIISMHSPLMNRVVDGDCCALEATRKDADRTSETASKLIGQSPKIASSAVRRIRDESTLTHEMVIRICYSLVMPGES